MTAPGAFRGVPPKPPALRGFESLSRFWDAQLGSWIATIISGDYYVTMNAETLSTVLGSCVATCVRDPRRKIAGMNHFMLPRPAGRYDHRTVMSYGAYSVERLINEMIKHGARREDLEIKIFGGGTIIESPARIGERNVAFIREYLAAEGLRITSEDVGGPWARRLRYHGVTGVVQVKRLATPDSRSIAAAEESLEKSLAAAAVVPGDVELF